MLVSSFGSSISFHDALLAATCDGVYATEPDYSVGHVAGRRHSDRLRIVAILRSLCGGPATEQATTCDGVYATEPDHYEGHAAGRGLMRVRFRPSCRP